MLNLLVMISFGMRLFLVFWIWAAAFNPQAQNGDSIEIASPTAGQAIQGVVQISGKTAIENYQSAEISYSYANGGSWFLIGQSHDPVEEGKLTVWDTSTISDGNYILRLQVFLTNGTSLEKEIQVRVRNYTPIETETVLPTQGVMSARSTPTITATPYQAATPTNLPNNPARVTEADFDGSVRVGIILSILFFGVVGLYLGYKRNRQLK